ncbi:hypothetical protein ABT174_18280 [Streptomyces sparsogenes]|uniref:hypothetical protein n=1 Tax=Streptomyces sparsogenes TaxID=67365 RepID=UPI00331D6DC0
MRTQRPPGEREPGDAPCAFARERQRRGSRPSEPTVAHACHWLGAQVTRAILGARAKMPPGALRRFAAQAAASLRGGPRPARGEHMPFETRARVRMDTGYVARRSREALDLLLSIQGAGSFAEANPLQRI